MKLHKCDVLVIGSGASGLRAAIEIHDKGLKVAVVGKCKRGDAHTVLATGGINAALGTMDPEDVWWIHATDTLKEGGFLAGYQAVETLCKNAPKAVNELVLWNVKFHRENDGRLTQRFFGAHTYRRTCFVGDETGKAIEEALVRAAESRNFPFMQDIYVTSLLKSGKKVKGAFSFNMKTGETHVFNAKCGLLATAGD